MNTHSYSTDSSPQITAYMLHSIPIAPTPITAPIPTVTTVAGIPSCCETGPSHDAGSVSAMDVLGRVMFDGDARHAALYAAK